MALSLEQLIEPLDSADIQEQQLRALAGIGYVTQAGTNVSAGAGTGAVEYVSGTPNGGYSVVIQIVVSGEPSAGTYRYSVDGGLSYSAAATLPASGATWTLGTTGVTMAFLAGPTGGGTSFVAGDTYSFSLAAPSFPVTAWQAGSVPRSLVAIDSDALADLAQAQASLARSAFSSTAEGAWQDLNAKEVYNLTRNPATPTKGYAVLNDTASAGPFTIQAGSMWIAAPNGLRYSNAATLTVPKSGSVVGLWEAEAAGAAYNVGNNSITTIVVNSLPGVTVNNPDAGSGTWIFQQGADEETDEALASRSRARWPALTESAPPKAVYDFWSRTASPNVTRTAIAASVVTPGQIDIYLAGPSGGSGPTEVTLVDDYIEQRTFGLVPNVAAATNVTVSVSGTATYDSTLATLASIQAGITTNLTALFAAAPIGTGNGEKLYADEVREAIMAVVGMRSISPLTSPGDVTLAAGQVPVLSLNFLSGWTFVAL